MDTRSITFNLIMVNVLLFFATMVIGREVMYSLFALFYPSNELFKPMQLISHMFMHASLLHIMSNMFALFMFGTILERVWGPKRFLLFYFVTGFGAVILHLGVQAFIMYQATGTIFPTDGAVNASMNFQAINSFEYPTLGASGAVFGILVGFGVLFPNTELQMLLFPIPIKAKYFISLYILWELYRGFTMASGDNVAHFAHLGGALFGFLLVKYWNRDRDYLY